MDKDEFEALNEEEQIKAFYEASYRDKGELLLYSHAPDDLTRSLAPEELYLLTREMDTDECGEIIRFANLPQLIFMADMDCWQKDRISPKGFLRWLRLLLESGNDQLLVQWLMECDYPMLIAGFRNVMEVMKPEWENAVDELLGDKPYFTLDEHYFVSVNEEDFQTVKRTLERLFENHKGRYVAVLEGVISEITDELEEEGYRNREGRLSELGFPDLDSARRMYAAMTLEEFEAFPKKVSEEKINVRGDGGEINLPDYAGLWSEERLFLDEVLRHIHMQDEHGSKQVNEEMVWLTNKVLACEGLDFASEELVKKGIQRARFLLNLGLELLTKRDLDKASELMTTRWLETIVRHAIYHLVALRDEAETIADNYWHTSQKLFLTLLDSPYDQIFRGIFQTVPQYHEVAHERSDVAWRDFRDTEELQGTRELVKRFTRLHEYFESQFQVPFDLLQEEQEEGSQTTIFSLMATLFARFVLKEEVAVAPFNAADVLRFIKVAFTASPRGAEIKREYIEDFMGRMVLTADLALLEALWLDAIQRLQEELAGLVDKPDVDLRYVSTLRLKLHESA